jgi:DNA phosphorothioation-dependent restriction protein DptH
MFSGEPFDWGHRRDKPVIFDLSDYAEADELLRFQIELLLWDLFLYSIDYGDQNDPFIVVVDEFQKLRIDNNSLIVKILREGRKFGWSLWLSTQYTEQGFKSVVKSAFEQVAVNIYFEPGASNCMKIAGHLGSTSSEIRRWSSELKILEQGKCIIRMDGMKVPEICQV